MINILHLYKKGEIDKEIRDMYKQEYDLNNEKLMSEQMKMMMTVQLNYK